MLDFQIKHDKKTNKQYLKTDIVGKALLNISQLNKGTAFSQREREAFGLTGKLPNKIETLEEQALRAYKQYHAFSNELQKNIYLTNLHNKNQILFYKVVTEHLQEVLPTVYTPYVSYSVENYSTEFRSPRGLYIAYPDIDQIEAILANRSNPKIDLIVVTDGESILGIGDQGVGGMDIPVAKLIMYSVCGGINPLRTLPIFLDVGTNNQQLLDDPFYLGLRQKRISGSAYDAFIDRFVSAVTKLFPDVFLHWEDFSRANATNILERYQENLCTFNDDVQGTGIVTLAALLAGCKVTQTPLTDQQIVIYGGGAAGTGIGAQILDALGRAGLSPEQARARVWMIDRQGLLLQSDESLTPAQTPFSKSDDAVHSWKLEHPHYISLQDTVQNVKPTILIGCSACAGAFTQPIIETMAKNCERPMIFPLSNPTERAEATPKQILTWTKGQALVATGSPFEPVKYGDRTITIAQCNNLLAFPGIGLGLLTSGSTRFTAEMVWKASQALSQASPANTDANAPLLPPISEAQAITKDIAIAVAQQSIDEGLAKHHKQIDNLAAAIEYNFWHPHYLPYRK